MTFNEVSTLLAWQFALYGACWLALGSILRANRSAVLAWGGYMTTLAAGFTLVIVRDQGPAWIGFTLSSCAFAIAVLLLQVGVDRFVGRRDLDRVSFALVGAAIVLFVVTGTGDDHAALRVLTSYVVNAAVVVRAVVRSRRHIRDEFGPRIAGSLVALAGLLVAPSLTQAARQIAVWPTPNGIHEDGDHGVVLFVYLVTAAIFNFGFMLLLVLRLVSRMRQQTLEDPLTGLPNRRSLDHELDRALDDLQHAHRSFSLVVIDVDHFKKVNDLLGHPAGDCVLEQLGQRLQAALGDTGFVARSGGEEFVVIVDAVGGAAEIGESLRRSIAVRPFEIEGAPLHITISVGVASATPDMTDPSDVLRRADTALYTAKQRGRNRVEVEPRRTLVAPTRAGTVADVIADPTIAGPHTDAPVVHAPRRPAPDTTPVRR